jgi:hypothetical protein
MFFFTRQALRLRKSAVATANNGSVSGHKVNAHEMPLTRRNGKGGAELDNRDVHELSGLGRVAQ